MIRRNLAVRTLSLKNSHRYINKCIPQYIGLAIRKTYFNMAKETIWRISHWSGNKQIAKSMIELEKPIIDPCFGYPLKEREEMSFVRVASKGELAPGTMKGVEANSTRILLVNLGDNYFAIGNVCKHMGCKLSSGVLAGEVVQCPCHGSRYKVRTGEIVRGSTTKPEPAYEVKVENDQIFVRV